MRIKWQETAEAGVYTGSDAKSGAEKWVASDVDLIFGSNSQLRPVAEVYAFNDALPKFIADFAAAWSKVMDLDRFD